MSDNNKNNEGFPLLYALNRALEKREYMDAWPLVKEFAKTSGPFFEDTVLATIDFLAKKYPRAALEAANAVEEATENNSTLRQKAEEKTFEIIDDFSKKDLSSTLRNVAAYASLTKNEKLKRRYVEKLLDLLDKDEAKINLPTSLKAARKTVISFSRPEENADLIKRGIEKTQDLLEVEYEYTSKEDLCCAMEAARASLFYVEWGSPLCKRALKNLEIRLDEYTEVDLDNAMIGSFHLIADDNIELRHAAVEIMLNILDKHGKKDIPKAVAAIERMEHFLENGSPLKEKAEELCRKLENQEQKIQEVPKMTVEAYLESIREMSL